MAVKAAVRLDGVVIGRLAGLSADGVPQVVHPGAPTACAARSTAVLGPDDVGVEVALLFENGDPLRPLVVGRLLRPEPVVATCDDERLCLEAEQEVSLRCGAASITLTRAGKVLIRGTYLSSCSSGVNRIKGGSVQLN